MKLTVDNFDVTTGWTASTGAAIHGLNTITEYIAGDLTASLILYFNAINSYCTKAMTAIDVSDYDDFTFHIWSKVATSKAYNSIDDYVYKIDLGSGKEYYLKASQIMDDVTIDISDITTIDRIRITALTADTDYLVLSYGLVSKDEMPYDIFVGVKERFESLIAAKYTTKYLIGTIGICYTGDDSITFMADPYWVARYSKIYITDGVHTEYHHVSRKEDRTIYFSSLYDGLKLIHDYTTALVYISIPAEFGKYEAEIVLPSITVWGLSPENIPMETDIQTDLDTWKVGGSVNEGTTGKWFRYSLLIDCESENVEMLAAISNIVNVIIGRLYVWINGKRCHLVYKGAPTVIEPTEVVANIPKIQYNADVLIKENVFDKVRIPQWITTTNTYDIINSGDQ